MTIANLKKVNPTRSKLVLFAACTNCFITNLKFAALSCVASFGSLLLCLLCDGWLVLIAVYCLQLKKQDLLSNSIQTRSKAHNIIKRMLASLGDPYTRYLSPEEVIHSSIFIAYGDLLPRFTILDIAENHGHLWLTQQK